MKVLFAVEEDDGEDIGEVNGHDRRDLGQKG
jgi:hypothetical protein